MEEEIANDPVGRLSRFRLFGGILLVLLLLGLIVLWISRTTLADNFVQSQLDQMDVAASYEIDDIGLRKQVIRNLVIGDPERPDLTAELVEVGNSLSLGGVGINWVRASGVKLYGRVEEGKLSFGELDKFSDPEDDSPLALPDMWMGLDDAKLRIDSEYGAIGLALNGQGELHNGFSGEIAAIASQLNAGGCALQKPTFFGEIAIRDKKPRLEGPLRLPAFTCDSLDLGAEDFAARIAIDLGADLASWTGNIGLIGGPLRYAGYSSQEIRATLDLAGDLQQSSGAVDLTASGLQSPYGKANISQIKGPFTLGYGSAPMTARFSGQPEIRGVQVSQRYLRQTASLSASFAGTPLGPIASRLSHAVQRAGSRFDLSSDIEFSRTAERTTLSFDAAAARSRSGASISLSDPLLLVFTDKNIRMLADGPVRLAGGGFPSTRLQLDDGSLSRGFSGALAMANYQVGSAQLKIPVMTFSPTRQGGTSIDGRIILTGPLGDGQLTGLQIPVSGNIGRNGDFALFRRCVDLQFASLRTAALTAGPTSARLCPQGSAIVTGNGTGVNIAASAPSLKLDGAVGSTPLAITSGALGFSLANGLTARNVGVRLGTAESMTRLDMAVLNAAFGSAINGRIEGASGKVANVPLLMEKIEGDWRYENGAFLADASLLVRDEQPVERFRPLISNDVKLGFDGNDLTATGLLREPESLASVATIDIAHGLDDSEGRALIDVQSLIFNDRLQPEQLTPLTLGVIANVQGEISGTGRIDWDASENGIKSTGSFRSHGLNLAAAFGPVTGLAGEIEFSDLLGLETRPGQVVTLSEVNPGVAVFNGQIRYRLLPDFKLQVEAGEWPFAGGKLYLEPTILDLSEEAERRLQFTVEGVDAAQFLTQFDFENMTASGVFDGKLPMVFDQDGGRVVGGYLVAREGGGTLAYVGELSYEDMGTMANFAFNALKSIRYRNLTIGMDGDIAGEIITEVKFAGLQQGEDASRNFITKQLARIPLEFNVRIQAPFMQLMSSAKSYYEPEILVGQNLPALLRAQEARAKAAVKVLEEDE
ncbi:intermembrane phospholipid transport protein YdbH family protein [Sphingorhabdus sp. 109]|uniref:intermembrane phospholipid transport protein YdbH family protein n=1 Tax=Sphingorhabdus sp. 109 TaxID=2653173 RepID=UPI0012EEECD0|nr:YdbH domain-containing protein [Sphingorhabdus sp. 109]VWX56635.1 Dicarboxylate transport [Sphingorhabdus sp. 109]